MQPQPGTEPTRSARNESIATRLSSPVSSTSELLELLVPPLVALDLVPDLSPAFLLRFQARSDDSPIDPAKFVKRQLGFVQRILVEKVWPDWETALRAEEGLEGLSIFERWFIPPLRATRSSANDGRVAMSSYAVLSTLLSNKSARTLQPRSLEIVSDLLVKFGPIFNVSELYAATLANATHSPHRTRNGTESDEVDEDEDENIDPTSLASWEQSFKDLVAIPVRIANAWGKISAISGTRAGGSVPIELTTDVYESNLAVSYLDLLWGLSATSAPVFPSTLSTPLKFFVSSRAFLRAALPILTARILPPTTFPTPAETLLRRQRHIDLVRKVFGELADREASKILRNLLAKLSRDLRASTGCEEGGGGRGGPEESRAKSAKAAAFVLSGLFGPLEPSSSASGCWAAVVETLVDRNCLWDHEMVPLIVVCWLEQGGTKEAVTKLLDKIQAVWGSREEMQNGFETRRTYLTSLLLVLVASLPPTHPSIVALSKSTVFLNAISSSLHTVSPMSRLLGMLVAEVVSNRALDPASGVEPLDFGAGIWDGDAPGKGTIRDLRNLYRDVETGYLDVQGWKGLLSATYPLDGDADPTRAERNSSAARARPRHDPKPVQPTSVEEPAQPRPKRPLISIVGSDDDEDDSLEAQGEKLKPYPLPAGPSDATLDALSSSDPSLYQSAYSTPSAHPTSTRRRGKLRPPVYIFELTEYLRGKDPDGVASGQNKEEADQEAERVEMALKEGEGLIRRKSGWGHELKENAVNLAVALMSLQDNYELENFEASRQRMLTALIAGCPVEVAPCVIEHYFLPTYSISQLHTFLTSVALAARELAQLPAFTEASPTRAPQQSEATRFPSKQLPAALHRRLMASQAGGDTLQALTADLTSLALSDARQDAETTLPEAARDKLLSVRRFNSTSAALKRPAAREASTPPYTTLCAEYFILPLLNRFWLYLRDSATSTLHHGSSSVASSRGPYAGGPSSLPILEPLLLSKYLATVSILLHAARHAPSFLAVLAPEALALVVSLRPPASTTRRREPIELGEGNDPSVVDRDLVISAEMELVLLILSTSHSLDGGHALTRHSFELLAEVQSWAEEVFEVEENKAGGAAVGRAGRSAAGILLRLEEILGRWRGRVGWE